MLTYLNDLTTAIKATSWVKLEGLSNELKRQRAEGRRVFVCGNGGSYAVATHWGVDLAKVGRLEIHTLGTNMAYLTAYANDVGYEVGLSTELSLRARPGDLVVALSCSGRSRNIVAVLGEAKKLQLAIYMITGSLAPVFDGVREIRIASNDYGILEDVFSAIGHWLTRELAT